MNSWRFLPKDSTVAKYLDSYWFLEKDPNDLTEQYPKLYPDPSAHMLIVAAAEPYGYHHGTSKISGSGAHYLCAHRATFVIDHSQPFSMLGLKFKIGAPYSMALPTEIDSVVEAPQLPLFTKSFLNIDGLLEKCSSSPESAAADLDRILLSSFNSPREDRHSQLARRALVKISENAIGELGERLNCSQRTLERSFLSVTGLTLKQCQSMIRFEEILDYLNKAEADSIDWLDLVHQFGFSDQPHFIRYLKQCIGVTPSVYADQRDLTIDVYGNFELD